MKTAPDGRRIFVWHGKNPAEDTSRLTEAIAETCIAELFELNGSLVWLNEGQLVPVNKNVLRDLIARHFVSVRLVHRGNDVWEADYSSFDFPIVADTSKEPNERVLIDIIAALLERVAKGPSAPRELSDQQRREVRDRLKIGEPPGQVGTRVCGSC